MLTRPELRALRTPAGSAFPGPWPGHWGRARRTARLAALRGVSPGGRLGGGSVAAVLPVLPGPSGQSSAGQSSAGQVSARSAPGTGPPGSPARALVLPGVVLAGLVSARDERLGVLGQLDLGLGAPRGGTVGAAVGLGERGTRVGRAGQRIVTAAGAGGAPCPAERARSRCPAGCRGPGHGSRRGRLAPVLCSREPPLSARPRPCPPAAPGCPGGEVAGPAALSGPLVCGTRERPAVLRTREEPRDPEELRWPPGSEGPGGSVALTATGRRPLVGGSRPALTRSIRSVRSPQSSRSCWACAGRVPALVAVGLERRPRRELRSVAGRPPEILADGKPPEVLAEGKPPDGSRRRSSPVPARRGWGQWAAGRR